MRCKQATSYEELKKALENEEVNMVILNGYSSFQYPYIRNNKKNKGTKA